MYVVLLKFVLLLFVLFPTLDASLDANLITEFFTSKSLRFGYVFDCMSNKERIIFTNTLMQNQLRISENKIEQCNLVFTRSLVQFSHHYGVIVDGDCDNINYLIKQAEIFQLFDDRHHWFIVTSNDTFLHQFRNTKLNINVDVSVALFNKTIKGKAQNWTIIDVYNPAHAQGGELKSEHVGFYNVKQGFRYEINKENKYWTRKNMTGVTFKTMVVVRQPFERTLEEYLEYGSNRRKDAFTGFQYRLSKLCRELYNFSLKTTMTDTWGYKENRFTGLTGALHKKEIDFGSTALYFKLERIPLVDFAAGLWKFREIIVFRQPQRRSFHQIFLYPMSTSAWLATVFALLLILISLKFSQRFELNIIKSVMGSLDQTWSSLILFTLGAFCQQGSADTPNLFGGRIITITILTFCFLFYQFYSGTIVSFLLVKPPVTIKNAEDLLRSSLEVGSDDAPYIRDFFETATDPVAIELYKKKILNPNGSANYFPPQHGLNLVANGGFSYQVEFTAGYIIMQDTFSNEAICELGEVQIFPTKTLMTVLPKNSPFRDLFNYCILRLSEHGIGAYLKAHWSARKPDCLPSSTSLSIKVGFKQIYPAVVLLFIGMGISLVVLGFEILIKNKKSPKKKIKNNYLH